MNENLYTYAGLRRYAEKQSDRIEELEAEVERLDREYDALHQRVIPKLEAKVKQLERLLHNWYETWNDDFQPEGDLLDETLAALEDDDE